MRFNWKYMPDQNGRTAIVTGANAGLGYETTRMLAEKGASVVMACRNQHKADTARSEILQIVPGANLQVEILDLASLASVRAFAERINDKRDNLDLLINNAGVMIPPYQVTEDGFELQFGANYLGHFLLTGLLLPLLEKTPASRVVSLSSNAHKRGDINFDDLQSEQEYSRFEAYCQSKLACLIFARELQRRVDAAGLDIMSTAAHPGASVTELVRHIPKPLMFVANPFAPLVTHSPADGAIPTIQAALDSDAKGGDYFGPQGFQEMKGPSGPAKSTRRSRNEEIARRLWEVSEELTGIKYL